MDTCTYMGRHVFAPVLTCACGCFRYLIAEGEGRMYVAFMGTKQRRDLVTNANILQEPVWPELVETLDDDDFRINVSSAFWSSFSPSDMKW